MYLTQGLHRSLQQMPTEVALIDDGRPISFAELVDRVARLAAGLTQLGAVQGDRVGILAPNSARYVEYALACPWGGFVFAPVNSQWSLQEMAYQIVDADIAVLLLDDDTVSQAVQLQQMCPGLTTLVHCGGHPTPPKMIGYEDLIAQASAMEDVRLTGDALAGILYTGGTTGQPKGVMVSPAQLLVSTFGFMATSGMPNERERFLHVAPLYHLAALGACYQQAQLGSTHFVLGQFTVEGLAATIAKDRITAVTLVPTMIQRLFDYAEATGADLSSLQHLGYGASPISEPVLRKALQTLPDLQMCQLYGMTELGPVATVLRPEDHRDQDHPERLRSAGRAALHAEIRVVDATDATVDTGTVGEVIVRGANIMLGYWNKPAETALALRGGWMHTGDLGYLDEDGYLYVVDRLKDMIVTGGENVYSAEVEKVLATHPSISSCAVIGVPDEQWGERVHAVVVATPGTDLDAAAIREYCAQQLARYKAPRTVDIVTELPLSPVGKILKRTLREQYRTLDSTRTQA